MASNAKMPQIIAIILTFNQREKTLECLSSLLELQEPPSQILVWDNGSQDGTDQAIKAAFPGVLVHYQPTNFGVAMGRNAAAELAIKQLRATHLLFLDNDIQVKAGFVQALFSPFDKDPELGQTQAKLLFMHDRDRINYGGGAQIDFVFWHVRPIGYGEIDCGQYDNSLECIPCGPAMMVRADLFQKLGGFDPLFNPFGPEDVDFSLRLKKLGYHALYIPQAVAYHQVSHTFGKGYTEDYARHKSRHWLLFMHRHATPMQKIAFYFIGAPCLAVRVTIREVKRGNWKAVRGLVRGVLKI